MRGRLGVAAAAALALVATAALVVIPSAPAVAAIGDSGTSTGSGSAVVANAGTGRNKDRIVWVNWGSHGTTLLNNASVKTWQQVGDTTRLEVTCTLTGATANALMAYRPGNWVNDGLTRLYRTSDPTNNLVAGIGLINAGTQTFTVSCATAQLVTYTDATFGTVSGTPLTVTLAGLVIADAESTGATEHVYASPSNGSATTWRVIDAYGGTCGTNYSAQASAPASTNQLRLTSNGECSGTGNYSATAVAFAQGATSLTVELTGSGLGSAAIGYVLAVDYGDAPASYGTPGGVVQPTWAGTALTNTTTTVVNAGTVQTATLSTMTAPTTRLGAQAFPNASPPYSAAANGDTGWAVPPAVTLTADEDAIATPAAIVYTRGVTTTYTLAGVSCATGAFVKGWIDWDRDGTFANDEGSGTVTCAASTASLVFTIPTDVPDGVAVGGDQTFIRLQTAVTSAQLGQTSIVAAGEVEDWPVLLQVPKLQVTKTANATTIPAAPGVVTYTVTATNVGNGAFTAGVPAYVYDYYAAAADDATLGAFTSNPTGVTNSVANSLLTWSGALAVNASVTVTIPMTVKATPGDLVMTNIARASSFSLGTGAAQAGCSAAELTAVTCATHTLYRVGVTVTKTAYLATDTTFTTPIATGTALTPGTVIVWRYVVTNTGSGALTNVVLTDTATDTATTIAGTTSATTNPTISCTGAPAVTPGASVTIATLAAGASRTCTASGTIGGP